MVGNTRPARSGDKSGRGLVKALQPGQEHKSQVWGQLVGLLSYWCMPGPELGLG